MSVTVTDPISDGYIPNGVTTVFGFDFKIASTEEVSVYQTLDGIVSIISPGDYAVTLANDDEGGTITFDVAPLAGSGTLYIASAPHFTETSTFGAEGPFTPKSLNDLIDRAAIRDVYLKGRIDAAQAELDLAASNDELDSAIASESAARGAGDASLLQAILAIQNAGGTLPLSGVVLTPANFGGVLYDPLNEVDSSNALQAFYDAFQSDAIAREFEGDASGDWKVTRNIMATYGPNEPNVTRRFKAPALRVPPVAQLPGGVPLDYVLDIAGNNLRWEGTTGVFPTGVTRRDLAFRPFASRSFKRAVRLRHVGNSIFGDFEAQCAKRDVVKMVSSNSPFTVNGITFALSNCIGASIGSIYGVLCGSSYGNYETTPMVASARIQGKFTGAAYSAETFVADPSGMGGDTAQRTKLTVPSTAELEVYDTIFSRVELTAAVYGTIAASNSASTFIWSAGDPTNLDGAGHGLAVGDVYPTFLNGADANKEFRIVSFGGTSNRTITVTPAPADLVATASASYNHNSEWRVQWVTSIIDATNFLVYPWVADRDTNSFHLVSGYAVAAEGPNLANVRVASSRALGCGGSVYSKGLYGIKVADVLAEGTPIGVHMGDDNLLHQGLHIGGGHYGTRDGCDVSLLSASGNVYGEIKGLSDFSLASCRAYGPRLGTNSQRPSDQILGYLTLKALDGTIHETFFDGRVNGGYEGFAPATINNSKAQRNLAIHVDAATITVRLDRDEARLFPKNNWIEILWTGPVGADPSGTLTLNLDASLVALGWAYAGAGSGSSYAIVNPAKSVFLRIYFNFANKKAIIMRTNDA